MRLQPLFENTPALFPQTRMIFLFTPSKSAISQTLEPCSDHRLYGPSAHWRDESPHRRPGATVEHSAADRADKLSDHFSRCIGPCTPGSYVALLGPTVQMTPLVGTRDIVVPRLRSKFSNVDPQSILSTIRSSKDPLSPLFLAFSSMRSLSS